jgi:SOS-response transcriptional repressor LexA
VENIEMTIGDRIKSARKALGITQVELSKAARVLQSTIGDLERGRTSGTPSLVQIAKALKVSADWLATGKGARELSNVASAPDVRGFVPLISWVQAGEFAEAIDVGSNADCELVPITVPKLRHTFALAVVGDSMSPDFPPGMRLIVEPDLEYQAGDYVIAKNGGEATFKQLVRDGSDWYLKPINPQYPTKLLGESRIIGVVREAVRKFR